jgi:hypothetical protein
MREHTEFDIRPCERPLHKDQMYRDLTQNRYFAETAIAVADRFFKFDFSEVWFSGFIKEDESSPYEQPENRPLLYVKVWNQADLWYDVAFCDTGLTGTLHVDLRDEEEALGQDLIGCMVRALNQSKGLEESMRREVDAKVDGAYLHLSLDMRP